MTIMLDNNELFEKKSDEPISDEKLAEHCAIVKRIIESQDEERRLLRQIVLALGLRGRSYTYDEMEVRRYELLKAAGLKTDALSWNAHRIVKRNELKQKTAELKKQMDDAALGSGDGDK